MEQKLPIEEKIHKILTTHIGDLVQAYAKTTMPKNVFLQDLLTQLKAMEHDLGFRLDQYLRTLQFEKVQIWQQKFAKMEMMLTCHLDTPIITNKAEKKNMQMQKKVVAKVPSKKQTDFHEELVYSAGDVKEVMI